MSSSVEKDGWVLLQSWKTRAALVQVKLIPVDASGEPTFTVRSFGVITEMDDDALFIASSDLDLFVSLGGARFKSAGPLPGTLPLGLDPATYDEMVELVLRNLEALTLSCKPVPVAAPVVN